MKSDKIDISIVIAVYNSSDCLRELLRRLLAILDQMKKRYEIILIDDASPDNSWEVIQDLKRQCHSVSAIRLMRNVGQAKATMCGLSYARGNIVVTMDDDLQHRPDQLFKLINALETHPDIDCVFGIFKKKFHSYYRNIGSRIIRWINERSVGLPQKSDYSSFRAMRKQTVEAIISHQTQNPAISALVFSSTTRTKSVLVEHDERYSGVSGYTLSKEIGLALDNIINVSMLPLRIVTALGIGICVFSLIIIINVLIRYFFGRITVAGWATVVILISFFSGAILLAVGILGEYTVRVLREVRGAPKFVIREKTGFIVSTKNQLNTEKENND